MHKHQRLWYKSKRRICRLYSGVRGTFVLVGDGLTCSTSPSGQVHKFSNLSDAEATLVEPVSSVISGIDKLGLRSGADVLVLGAGLSGDFPE